MTSRSAGTRFSAVGGRYAPCDDDGNVNDHDEGLRMGGPIAIRGQVAPILRRRGEGPGRGKVDCASLELQKRCQTTIFRSPEFLNCV